MNITILTDNPESWYIFYVKELIKVLSKKNNVNHIFDKSDIKNGDIMFILSCEKILSSKYLKFHKNNIVIHPSKLPLGKGWSPLAWQILDNQNSIPFSLFEANEGLDSGDIYFVRYLYLKGHEINDEIKELQGKMFNEMVLEFVDNYKEIIPIKQEGQESFFSKRTNLDRLPFFVKDFRVGYNAMNNDYGKIEEIADWIRENKIENHVFLFSASSFTNLAVYQLFREFPNNTYIDIGTCLTPMMDMPTHRGYLQAFWTYKINDDIKKICIWN